MKRGRSPMGVVMKPLTRAYAFALAVTLLPVVALAAPLGDVNLDDIVDVGDAALLQRYLAGEVSLDAEQLTAADVAPLSGGVPAPDGVVEVGDLVVLLRGIAGEITIPAPPAAPVLDPLPNPTTLNPLPITGSATPGHEVTLYVNDEAQATVVANPGDGSLPPLSAILLDGDNSIYAIAHDGLQASEPSPTQIVYYDNQIPRTQSGEISQDTVWTPGIPATPYVITGNLSVEEDVLFVLQPGTELKFDNNFSLVINGTLRIQGTDLEKVKLTSNDANPGPGDWNGIDVTGANASAVIDYAEIDFVKKGIEITGEASAVVSNTEITGFSQIGGSGTGIRVATDASATVTSVLIDSQSGTVGYGFVITGAGAVSIDVCEVYNTRYGFWISDSSPTVSGCRVEQNSNGLYILFKSNPHIVGGNTIANNDTYGIYVQGNSVDPDPQPVITNNDIFDNGGTAEGRDYKAIYFQEPGGVVLDASYNWWGTAVAAEIPAKISDYSDRTLTNNPPIVGFTPFLDGSALAGGQPVPGNFLNGHVSGTLTAVEPYEVLGDLLVPETDTLNIEAGAELRFYSGTQLAADGTLAVAGTSGQPVLFTTAETPLVRGAWDGLFLGSTSGGSTVNYALIEYADQGITVEEADVTISNCEIVEFLTDGIYMDSVLASTITTNLIDNADQTGTGIHLVDSSPHVTGNTVQNNDIGIHLYLASEPVINGENTITNNKTGIFLQGIGEGGINPNPTINRNNIYANVHPYNGPSNLAILNFFFPGVNQVINARENWWGTPDPSAIRESFYYEQTDPPTPIDFSDRLDGVNGDPIPGALFTNTLTNVTHSVTHFRPAFGEDVSISFDLVVPSTVIVTLYPELEAPAAFVRQIQQSLGAGPQAIVWDGKNDQGGTVSDDAYAYRIEADDGFGNTGLYDPPRDLGVTPPNTQIQYIPRSNEFAPYKNEFWKREISVQREETRFTLGVSPDGGENFTAIDGVPLWTGETHLVMWDGRDPNGDIVSGVIQLHFVLGPPDSQKTNMLYNQVIVHDTTPTPIGTGTAPNIEVKSDPYLIHHSYEQFSKIAYQLDQDAHVTIKLLPPGVSDPSDPSAIAIVTNDPEPAEDQGQPIIYTHEWLGHAVGDTNAINVAAEGAYTFTIEATSDATALTSLYRGVLQIRN